MACGWSFKARLLAVVTGVQRENDYPEIVGISGISEPASELDQDISTMIRGGSFFISIGVILNITEE